MDTAVGRTATVHLDELGRERVTELALGADYSNKTLLAGARTYDSVGRVRFEAEPYSSDQDATTAYGTTQYFNADGTPWCSIRGRGAQPDPRLSLPPSSVPSTDETSEYYPTCFSRTFQDHTEVSSVQDSASLLAHSPQQGVIKSGSVTARGRIVARATKQGSSRLEYATFTHDHLGHLASMTRYQNAAAGSNPVTSSWHTDSLGQILELDEPDSVPQFNSYSNWGELIETNRTVGDVLKRVVRTYDARSRLIHSEQQTDGVVDPETVRNYSYDIGVKIAPQVNPTNVLGRLAQASWPTGAVTFSYDALGRIDAQVFGDGVGANYVEKRTFHGDGSPSALDLYLPDTGFANEHVDYLYDSAGRGTSVTYTNGTSQSLFNAVGTIDPFGRVRAAQYGQTTYAATYADLGRRLMSQVSVTSPHGSHSISFQNLDPIGRERGRTEVKHDDLTKGATISDSYNYTYDALGRLSTAVRTTNTSTVLNQQFSYDALGNLLSLTNVGTPSTANVTMTYGTTDRDRICSIGFGSSGGTACNVTYDEVGSIMLQPTPTGSRQYDYLIDGSVRTVLDGNGSHAHFHYDAFGNAQTLDLTSGSGVPADDRQDQHFGPLLTSRKENGNTVLTRSIPGPDGFIATRHGPAGPWVFAFGCGSFRVGSSGAISIT